MSALEGSLSPVDAFADYLAALPNEDAFNRAVSQAKLKAAAQAPDEMMPEAPSIGRRASELLAEVPEDPNWLIPRVAARGWMVKVAAREKTGKGTLIFYLLGCLEHGKPTVFGPAAAPASALIYTEEPQESVREKIEHAGLEHATIIYGWEMAKAKIITWEDKCAYLAQRAADDGHDVLFVDNISRAAGVEDEAGVELARAAEVLGDEARVAGLTTIIDHHHKKGAGRLDDKSRGGTALAGACDNNVEMVRVGGWDSRVRKLSSRGRLSATIWEQTVALQQDGKGYDSVADDTQPQTLKERLRLGKLSAAGDAGMTAAEFAAAINSSNDTARRVLDDFASKGWAAEDSDAYPARWQSTGEGLTEDPVLEHSGPWE